MSVETTALVQMFGGNRAEPVCLTCGAMVPGWTDPTFRRIHYKWHVRHGDITEDESPHDGKAVGE